MTLSVRSIRLAERAPTWRRALGFLVPHRASLLALSKSALDAESEALVQEALDRLMVGRTCVIAAHRLSTVVRADRILVLREGRVIEQGTHRELVDRGGYYASLVAKQVGPLLGAA